MSWDWPATLGGFTAVATALAAIAAWKAASRAADAAEELVKVEKGRDVRSESLDVVVSLDEEDHELHGTTTTVFTIDVNNRSTFPVRVVGVAIVGFDQPVKKYLAGGWDVDLPRNVDARDGQVIDVPLSAVAGDLPRGLAQAWVQLATGDELRSGPTDLPAIRNQGGSDDE